MIKPARAVLLLAALLFIANIWGYDMWAPDEPFFGEGAREMVVDGQWLVTHVNGVVNSHKPPLFFWLQVLSMKLFGINEFAARFPNLVCGILSMVMLYYLGRKLYGHRFGMLWILSYGSAILPFFFFKSGAKKTAPCSARPLFYSVVLSTSQQMVFGGVAG